MNCRIERSWIWRVLGLIILAGGTAAPCAAQSKLLSASIESSSQTSRTQGPVVVVWRLNSEHAGVLRGNLVATIVDGPDMVAQLTTDELAIVAGGQSVRMMLPSIDSRHGGGALSELKIVLRFNGPDLRAKLGDFPLRIPTQWERGFSIAVCDPWQSMIPTDTQKFIQSLRFETWLNEPKPNQPRESSISTVPSHFHPRDLPTEPLGYCGFNLLLLMREGLTELSDDQLDAVTDWVHAGGAVCLVPDSLALDKSHLQFLDRLAGTGVAKEPLIADANGRLMVDAAAEPRFARFGLGRVALLWGSREKPAKTPEELHRTLAFVWNLRHERVEPFISTGAWEPVKADPAANNAAINMPYDRTYFRQVRPPTNQLAPEPIQSGDQLLGLLIPRSMRLLPLWLVGLILFGYVLLIGPVDYFGLGFLRQRKWTWALFPLVTFGVTMATVRLSHWYMGNTETQKRVVVADVGRDGRLARTSEYRMRVSGTERVFETEVAGGVFTTVDYRRYSAGGWYNQQINIQQGGGDKDNTGSGAPLMFGTVPSRYVVRQFLPQWSPRLNRVFRIERNQAKETARSIRDEGVDAASNRPTRGLPNLEFDWNQFADPDKYNPVSLKQTDVRFSLGKVVDAVPDVKEALVLTGDLQIPVGSRNNAAFRTLENMNQNRYYVSSPDSVRDGVFLKNICVNEQGGLYDQFARLAPHGGGDFEDLPLLDPSSPNEWMLVLCIERGDELIVWRKLYTGEK